MTAGNEPTCSLEETCARAAKTLDEYARIAGLDPAAREDKRGVFVRLLADLEGLADGVSGREWNDLSTEAYLLYTDGLKSRDLDAED